MNISLVRPLPDGVGRVSQWFGEHPEWYAKYGHPGHSGIDYAAPLGTPVIATHNGRCFVGWDQDGYGRYIKLVDESGEWQTLYAHLNATCVVNEQVVKQNETIGNVGSTGNSTGNHLHFEVRFIGDHKDRSGYKGRVNPVPFRDATAQRKVTNEECDG